ncbi:MAG: peptide chain release factor 1 [Deltaproteobacteria bacterium]|nr:MAG: peptide chain release factor 1 [Deltaproteobacteria bacterium]
MVDRLTDVEARFEALTERMSDPSVAANPSEYRKVAKERAALEEVVAAFRDYKRVQSELAESRALAEESDDPEMRALAKEEVQRLEEEDARLEERLKLLLLPKDPNDEKNVILEIRAGTGGEEAALFAGDLMRMYLRYAERKGWKTEILSLSESDRGGVKEAIIRIEGEGVYSALKFESGVHRVQRVPETESQGRIHTSAATVAVMPEAEEVDLQIDPSDLRIDVFRASGPGGQSVNTTDSAVRITHIPTGITVSMQDEKSQHKNKAKAMQVLRTRLLEAEKAKQEAERSELRRTMVGSGDRSDKIRTYNFPQDRLTDHRIGLTRHNLDAVLDGDLDEIVTACRTYFQAKMLEEAEREGA